MKWCCFFTVQRVSKEGSVPLCVDGSGNILKRYIMIENDIDMI